MVVASDFPTVALWPNGDVIFIHEDGKKLEAWQSKISAEEARRVSKNIGSLMRAIAPHSSVSNWTDQRTVEIIARDERRWRVSDIYGLTRDGAPTPVELTTDGKSGLVERPENRPTVPVGFMTAYKQLLALRPKRGIQFEPSDIELLFWGFEYAAGEPVPWPADVPPPPSDAVPREQEPSEPVLQSFVVASTYLPSLRAALREAHSSSPPRAIAFNGHKWSVQAQQRFRGQDAVDEILRCVHRGDK